MNGGNEMAISLSHGIIKRTLECPGQSRPIVIRSCEPVKNYRLVKRATLTVHEFV